MNKIIVYTREGFSGRSVEFTGNVLNLVEKGLNDSISSLKVIGAPWVAYHDINYDGNQRVFEEGEYPTLVDKGKFSSLRIITEDLRNPEIQLCRHKNYAGGDIVLSQEINLHLIDFADTATSHKVKSGVWVLYEHINREGRQLVSFPGQEVPNYVAIGFNDVVSHVRPLLSKA